MADEQKKLVLVVHGIGEQEPGETLDKLVSTIAADDPQTNNENPLGAQYEHFLLLHNSDERDRFPCHIRRIQTEHGETVFSEVYWADISRGPPGVLSTVIEVGRGILGLGHLVRENSSAIYGSSHPLKKASRLIVDTLHGPIASLTVMLAGTALLAFIIAAVFGDSTAAALHESTSDKCANSAIYDQATDWFVAVIGLLVGLGARYFCKESMSRFFRIFLAWIGAVGFMLLIAAAVSILTRTLGSPIEPRSLSVELWLRTALFAIDCQNLAGLSWYSFLMSYGLQLVWLVTIIAVVALIAAQAINSWRTKTSEAMPLYTVVCAIMVMLWIFATAAFWSFGQFFSPPTAINDDLFRQSTLMYIPASVLMIMIALVATYVWLRRAVLTRNKFAKSYRYDPAENEKLRLLVARKISIAFVIAVAVLALISISLTMVMLDLLPAPSDWMGWKAYLESKRSLFERGLQFALLFFALIATIFLLFRENVGAGLGISMDVITYFKGEPPAGGDGCWTYPLRDRIHGRFRTVMAAMLEREDPDEVIVISHSQGTVIALEAMREAAGSSSLGSDKPDKYKLVTMGSPYRHLYQRYFSKCFKLPTGLENRLEAWINVFSTDDFVGTVVGDWPGECPRNIAVDPIGHTHYWTDRRVITILQEKIGIV